MKPKNLKCPFTWETRQPLIFDRVFYIPEYYSQHSAFHFPGWEDPSLFGEKGKVFIEYCTGNGAWIVEKARAQPETHWVAVEIKFERVRKIWSKIKNYNLKNLIVVCGEALTFTQFYLPSHSIESCYVNFPDPWPKERHAKHRLIQAPFVQELSRVVKREGLATFVTDDLNYSQQMIQEMLNHENWTSSFPDPFYCTDWESYGSSYFDQLWRERGRMIRYMQFVNRSLS